MMISLGPEADRSTDTRFGLDAVTSARMAHLHRHSMTKEVTDWARITKGTVKITNCSEHSDQVRLKTGFHKAVQSMAT